jgi:hypothetical protein
MLCCAVLCCAVLYRHGVNLRHAGLLRSHIPAPGPLLAQTEGDPPAHTQTHAHAHRQALLRHRLRCELLLQCVGRALKNLLRDMLRAWVRSQRSDVSEQALRQILVQFLNLVSGAHVNSVRKGSALQYMLYNAVLCYAMLCFTMLCYTLRVLCVLTR